MFCCFRVRPPIDEYSVEIVSHARERNIRRRIGETMLPTPKAIIGGKCHQDWSKGFQVKSNSVRSVAGKV